MNIPLCFVAVLTLSTNILLAQQFVNPLNIPGTLSGASIALNIHAATTEFVAGHASNTMGFNTMSYLGPTLILDRDSAVAFHITNSIQDSTTVHWHGMHVPAQWDGGPMNMIAPGDSWDPHFKVMNKASTMWYHSHMHGETAKQVTLGLAGMMIIRDSIEAKLTLLRTYGIDDIPLIIQDKVIDNRYQLQPAPLGTTMMVNGTLTPVVTLPKQFVRLRLLNASIERTLNIGFSGHIQWHGDHMFYQIATDGGLLAAPVLLRRLRLSPAERTEILIDLSDVTDSVLMKSYSTELGAGVSGAFHQGPGGGTGPLDSVDFVFLKIIAGEPTATPITSVPSSLTSLELLNPALATKTRTKFLFGPQVPGGPFSIDLQGYNIGVINDTVLLGATEIWTFINRSPLGHPIHIHDVQFNILSRHGAPPPSSEIGWKDVFFIYPNDTVRVIARFDDFADSSFAYMYHCHILVHEDDGMMHQFIVVDTPKPSGVEAHTITNQPIIRVYPIPGSDRVRVTLADHANSQYYAIELLDVLGKSLIREASSTDDAVLNISSIPPGIYTIRATSPRGRTFIKPYVVAK